MKLVAPIIIFLSAFVVAIIDTSFLSFWEIFGATLLLTLAIILVMAVLELKEQVLIFAATGVFFYAVFSSVPVYILILTFFGLPLLIFFIKSKIAFEERNPLWPLTIFFLSDLLFVFILFIQTGQFSYAKILSLFSFAIINTLLSLTIYYIFKLIVSFFKLNK